MVSEPESENWVKKKKRVSQKRDNMYWQIVENGVAEPATGTILTYQQKIELDGQRLKDLKAKNYLFQAIDRSILETILCKDTSKHIWDSMKKKYQGTTRA